MKVQGIRAAQVTKNYEALKDMHLERSIIRRQD